MDDPMRMSGGPRILDAFHVVDDRGKVHTVQELLEYVTIATFGDKPGHTREFLRHFETATGLKVQPNDDGTFDIFDPSLAGKVSIRARRLR